MTAGGPVPKKGPGTYRRDCIIMGVAVGVTGTTFGVFADAAGLDLPRVVAMSALMFTGASQFAAVGVINDGGTGGAAVGAALLLAARNTLYGPVVRRALPVSTLAPAGRSPLRGRRDHRYGRCSDRPPGRRRRLPVGEHQSLAVLESGLGRWSGGRLCPGYTRDMGTRRCIPCHLRRAAPCPSAHGGWTNGSSGGSSYRVGCGAVHRARNPDPAVGTRFAACALRSSPPTAATGSWKRGGGRAVSWLLLIVLVVGSYALKALGVTTLGSTIERRLGPVVALVPASLFTALILVMTVEEAGELVIDARLSGVAAGAVAVWLKAPLIVVVLTAMAVTAGLRALS